MTDNPMPTDARILSRMCDVCGDDIDFPACCIAGEDYDPCDDGPECAEPSHMGVEEDAEATCSVCGAVGRITIDDETAHCVIGDDDPAWDRWTGGGE